MLNREISNESTMIDDLHLTMPDGSIQIFSNNNIINKAERQADEYELAEELAWLTRSGNRRQNCTRIKSRRNQEEEKKQAIKIDHAAKQSALLDQPSKNRGGKNFRKKLARTAFILDEQPEVPTEIIINQKPDKVSLKRAMRKPGHGERGKMMRFNELDSAGSSNFKSFEYMIDIYEEELRESE